jgi:virginiamycin B lyase
VALKIGNLTTAGTFTEFPVPSGRKPDVITAGPDGNIWFNQRQDNQIAKITLAGVVTEYPVPIANGNPAVLVVGLDGNLWLSETFGQGQPFTGSQLAKVTTAAAFTVYDNVPAFGFAFTFPSDLWFTESTANRIGHVNPQALGTPGTPQPATATPTPRPTPISCVGDCDGNGQVTVDEILTMVNIALGNEVVTKCLAGDANHDGQITVDEILTAVGNALNGCAVS